MSFEGWKEGTLKEIAVITMGQSPKGESCNKDGVGVPLLNGPTEFGESHPSPIQYTTDPKKLATIGCILFCVRGSVGRMNWADQDYAIGRGLASIKPKHDDTKHFVKGLLEYKLQYLKNVATGSTFPNISKDMLENLPVRIPPLNERVAISGFIKSIDEKIELNNRINKNLEEMAQAIFKSWFVDFEPFRDGEFVESELGMIPKGWKVSNFNCLVSNLIGGDWGKESPQGNYQSKVYCIRGADIPEVAKGSKGKIPVRFILEKNRQKKALQDGDIVIEISGGSPTQSTGRVALINKILLERFNSELICTNFCRVMKMKKRCYSVFVYLYMRYLYDKEVFFLFENGTTGIKNLDIKEFLEVYRIVVPPDEILEKFNREVEKLFSLIQQLGCENETLSTLRDTLLPKLMSGEIRVPLD